MNEAETSVLEPSAPIVFFLTFSFSVVSVSVEAPGKAFVFSFCWNSGITVYCLTQLM